MYKQRRKYSKEAEIVAVNASLFGNIVRKIVMLLSEISLSDQARLGGKSQCVHVCVYTVGYAVRVQSFGLFKRPFSVI